MIALVLHHPGVKSLGDALDRLAARSKSAVTDAAEARHQPGQAGNRQAGFPVVFHLLGERLDRRIDQRGQRHRPRRRAFRRARIVGAPLAARRTRRRAAARAPAAPPDPTPGASTIVSAMSAISRAIAGAVGSATGSAGWRSTGCPMRAIFSNAIPPRFRRSAAMSYLCRTVTSLSTGGALCYTRPSRDLLGRTGERARAPPCKSSSATTTSTKP